MWLTTSLAIIAIFLTEKYKNITDCTYTSFSNKLWSRFSSISCIHMRMNVYYCEYNSITYAGTARFPSPNICQPLLGYVKFYIYCRGGPFHSRVSHAMQSKYYSYSFCWLQHTFMTELEVGLEQAFCRGKLPHCRNTLSEVKTMEGPGYTELLSIKYLKTKLSPWLRVLLHLNYLPPRSICLTKLDWLWKCNK